MKYKFNENNNITGYIKEVLHNFNLPTIDVYVEGKTLIDGRCYIKNNNISKYQKKTGEFIKLVDFEYGKYILNSTINLKMNSSIYDIYTHEYLGEYLRFVRDYHKLDLMPLYNCFSYRTALEFNYSLDLDGNSFALNTSDTHFNYFLVPVKFDQEYTIAIDSTVPYELCTLIYTGNELLDISKELINESYKSIPGSLFSKPFLYKTPTATDSNSYWKYEKNTKLLLKLPKKIDSSIVVLEGNYLNNTNICGGVLISDYIIDEEDLDIKPSYKISPPTKLSLLSVNDGITYPFSDRLVEYLLKNAITPIDDIDDNIKRVQDSIYQNRIFRGVYGVWDSNLKNEIYEYSKKNIKYNNSDIYLCDDESSGSGVLLESTRYIKFKDLNYDLLYFVDRDVESLLRSL